MCIRDREELLALADHVYRQGKYNDVILIYLRDNYLGAVEDMAALRKSLCGFGIDTYTLDEEILMLSMFTRVYLEEAGEILAGYRRDGGKEKVILAFMTFLCFGWFMEGRPLEPEVSSWISRRLEEKGEMDLICRLAYLKWLSGRESLTGEPVSYTHLAGLEGGKKSEGGQDFLRSGKRRNRRVCPVRRYRRYGI